MNPAFSVILFTTLSGAGYGLLAWIGMQYALRPLPLQREVMLAALGFGLALVTIGLSSSVFHLGKPARAWRAFSQWRTSWLSREGVLSLITYVPALLLAWLIWRGESSVLSHGAGIALTLCSMATVACTAMIYACLKPVPAWQHQLVLPGYLLFALINGWMLFLVLASYGDWHPPTMALIDTAVLALALAVLKRSYWSAIDRIALPSRESATALEGIGTVTTFERPHTEANYLTREMGFVIARKHSRALRMIAMLLFAGVPLLAALIAAWLPAAAGIALWVAALAALAGAFVERWLFFAEAKHMVMLYY
jgi:DMSO reductase anchor subunit